MAYIGQGIKNGTFAKLDTSGNTYNGSNVTFDLGTQVGSPVQLLVSHDGVIQNPGTDYTLASNGTQITFTTAPASGASIFIMEISGAVGGPMNRDLNGEELILDVDGDTSITADTDDRIDFKIGGADDLKMTANAINVLSGTTLTIDSGATITNSGTANGFGTDPDGAQVFNESGASVDFRVESDNNANMFVVDGSTDCVAIGQAAGSGSYELDVAGDIRLYNSGDGFETIDFDSNRGSAGDFLGDITGKWNGTDVARISLRAGDDTTNKDDGRIHFEVSSAGGSLGESFKILANTDVQFGGNADIGINVTPGDAKFVIGEVFDNIAGIITNDQTSGSSSEGHYFIKRSNSTVGSITATNSSTAFNTSSDYRLKENVTYSWDATTRLKQLKPARFNWIRDDTNTLVDGFIAHEVTAVPEAIYGTKDATETKNNVVLDNEGNMLHHSITEAEWTAGKEETPPKYPTNSTWQASKEFIIPQQIDQAKLVPLLAKALQEAVTKIETLETKVKALEDA